ncbi:BgtAcSP-31262 [Blumeria graminis f. sp. tritici]|uniref:BgtAcSP-31262 n=2 Tax=Blumeria graminis f. sp. tritici TaxID=62690 RepID=A0A9X9LB27_BLUGR|nr:hypothetical protein BGT96224_AcSP31262 [Blumeria graminis f. sp. tritici 96224]VCU40770.1 BgtAcSP-31262 [Blumeria graminis f. sp. tritici]
MRLSTTVLLFQSFSLSAAVLQYYEKDNIYDENKVFNCYGSVISFGGLENYRSQARTALNQRTLPEVSITELESIISNQWQGFQVLYKSQAAQPRYFWHKLPGDSRDHIGTKYILIIDILGNISGLMANTASTTSRTPVTVANSHMCYIATG